MTTFRKTLRTGLAATLLLAGVTSGAQGFAPGGGGFSFGGGGRGAVQIKGIVLCAGCSLEEVRTAQADKQHLYQLTHKRGQVVMRVSEVNRSTMWDLPWPPQLWVRAQDEVFQRLMAEENLTKAVEITGILRNTRTLDIFGVTISG